MKTLRLFTLQHLVLIPLLFVYGMASCTEETTIYAPAVKGEQFTFTINVPPSPTVATRSIHQGAAADKAVQTIDLLLFDQTSKLYVNKVFSDQIVDISPTEKTFTVNIPNGRYDLVILANARSMVNAIITPDNAPQAKNKEEIYNLLIKTLPGKTDAPLTGIWNAQPGSSGYAHFPMWSEKLDFKTMASNVNLSVSLVRMLAKVNVTFKSKEVSEKLAIESILVCNFNQSGYIASNRWDFGTLDGVAQAQTNVNEKPSRLTGVSNGLLYENTADYATIIRKESDIQLCKDEIFLFESQKPADQTSEQQRIEATCLIIKGKYNGGSDDRYYRIDFAYREGSTIHYVNLLRNHIYSIVINNVNTAGHPSAQIAYESFGSDLNVGVSSWSDGGVGETAFDGQYTLSITPNEVELFRESSADNRFIIHTDYPVFPTITSVDYEDDDQANWIHTISEVVRTPLLDKENGKKKAYQVTFDCLENNTGHARLAKMSVTAGNHLNLKVNITQTATPLLALQIEEVTNNQPVPVSVLTFPSGRHTSDPITPKSMRVSWAPFDNNNECLSIATATGIDFDFGTGMQLPSGNTPLTDINGIITYANIAPPAFTEAEVSSPHEFLEKTRLYSYTVSNGVTSINKSLRISQTHYNAVANTAKYYFLNGNEYAFNVRSNSSWRITLGGKDGSNGDPKSVVTDFNPVQGGYDTKNGQVVRFSLTDDISTGGTIGQADVTFTISCTDPIRTFDPIEVSIHAMAGDVRELSNSYIVAPKTGPILIPVRRANGILLDHSSIPETNWWLGTQITPTGANAEFGVKLLWTDGPGANGKGLAADGVIQELKTIGSGDTGYLFVTPGTKEGNAVVAITRTPGVDGGEGTGDILWSFHIWVTDYDPYDTHRNEEIPQKYWMNRNLGAKTNLLGTADAYGLFYQFGRKDPFPGAATLTGTGTAAGKKMYDASGNPVSLKTASSVNAEGTVRNPLTLSYPWYGTSINGVSSVSDTPWNNNAKKTLYDPCPKGYRVPFYVNHPSDSDSHDWGNADILTGTGDGINTPKWTSGGIKWDNKGGLYPAAGFLAPDGTYYETGVIGYAWSATPTTDALYGYSLRFDSFNMRSNNSSAKNSVGAVRCVAE